MLTFDLVWRARWSGRSLPTFDLVFVQVEGRSLSLSTCLFLQVDECHHFRPVGCKWMECIAFDLSSVRGGAAAALTFDLVYRRGIDRVAREARGRELIWDRVGARSKMATSIMMK